MCGRLKVRHGHAVSLQYDAPSRPKTYVHRVGRTARAGQRGVTYTLLRPDQVRHFKEMMKRIENSSVRKETVLKDALKALLPRFTATLDAVRLSCWMYCIAVAHRSDRCGRRAVEGVFG